MNKQQLIESGIEKIVRRTLAENKRWIDKRRYNAARKGIEQISNSLFDLQNVAVDDPYRDQKKKMYDEFRKHFVAIRELLDDIA